MTVHIVPVKKYVFVFVALIVLTIATTEVARIDLGTFNIVVALLIAGGKAMLVVLFFMHMLWSSSRVRIVPAAGLLWLLIMIVLTMSDYLSRGWTSVPGGWQR